MRNIPHKITGDDLTADEFNDIPEEEENIVTSSGQALTSGDLYQIAKAVAMYVAVGDFYVDSGSGNNYVLTASSPLQAPHQYMDGFRVRFRISHTNTGASTINVNGLGIKAIVKEDGITPLGAGDLPIGEHGELVFHVDKDAFELYSHKYQDNTFLTGDLIYSSSNDAKPGWITYTSAGSIGSATSGATIRANADCELLFKKWWAKFSDSLCPVSGGRGVSAAADWTANKTMGVFPYYNYFTICAANSWAAYGAIYGEREHVLSLSEMSYHRHDPAVITDYGNLGNGSTAWSGGGGGNFGIGGNEYKTQYTGGSAAQNNVQPSCFMQLFVKL